MYGECDTKKISHRHVDVCLIYCKELNERERADHANTKYEQMKSLVTELENRNSELEQKFAEVRYPILFSRFIEKMLNADSDVKC